MYTLDRTMVLFRQLAPHLASCHEPLPHLSLNWSGPKTTRAEALALTQITPDLSAEEATRRRRACGGFIVERDDPGWLDQR
jgi:hypothetical protein